MWSERRLPDRDTSTEGCGQQEILHRTLQHHQEQVLCTNEDDGNQAVCWCRDCDDFLCEHCQMTHERLKITKHHDVLDIGELRPGSSEEEIYCPFHPRHILDAWDKDCCMLTCGKCRLGDHAGHEVADFDAVAETAKEEVSAFAQQIQSTVDTRGASSATGQGLKSEETCNILSEKITHTFNDMKVLLNQHEKELQMELQHYKEKLSEDLSEKKSCDRRSQAISDYIKKTLKYSSRHGILSLRPVLQSRAEQCINIVLASVHQNPPLPRFNTDGFVKIKSVLSGLGTIASTDDPVIVKEMRNSGTQTVDSLSRECENLKKELDQVKKENPTPRENLNREETEKHPCTHVEFSKTKYNADSVHINIENELINRPLTNPPDSDHRLKTYGGTCSTISLSQCESFLYFEVKSKVGIAETLTGGILLLEIGLARGQEQDQRHAVNRLANSYSLTVAHCPTHSSICRHVWRHGEHLTCLPYTMDNIPGTTSILHYGVVCDIVKKRIAFLDIKTGKIICRVRNINRSVDLWPMFGVYNPDTASVSMSLVVGSDINKTESKWALILKSLS